MQSDGDGGWGLGLVGEDPVTRVRRVRKLGGEPVIVDTNIVSDVLFSVLKIDCTAFGLDVVLAEWHLILCEIGAHYYRVELA